MLKKLHHVAYRCLDAAETADFYVNALGLKFVAALVQEFVPSIQKTDPHNHIFFEMEDGSYIAFFDVLNDKAAPREHDWAQHLALEIESVERGELVAGRLRARGVNVIGPVSHDMCKSWYFHDPSGHRLEMSFRTDSAEMWRKSAEEVPHQMAIWNKRKEEASQ